MTPEPLPGVLEAVAAGVLDGEPRVGAAPAAAAWRAAGGRADDERAASPARFVYRSTSTMPVHAPPYDPARVLWLAERGDLDRGEAALLRSVCRRLAADPDPARAAAARAGSRWLDERAADRGQDDAAAPGGQARAAFARRDYRRLLALLAAARAAGAEGGTPKEDIPAEVAAYWLDG